MLDYNVINEGFDIFKADEIKHLDVWIVKYEGEKTKCEVVPCKSQQIGLCALKNVHGFLPQELLMTQGYCRQKQFPSKIDQRQGQVNCIGLCGDDKIRPLQKALRESAFVFHANQKR